MAKYAQIIWAEPTNDDVRGRNEAVETLCARLRTMSTREAIALAATVADAFAGKALPPELGPHVEKAISDASPAFVLNGNEQQALVCLAVAALATVQKPLGDESGWNTPDALAASLWSALTLQDQVDHAKTEELRQDLIEASRRRVRLVAKAARERLQVPDVGTLTIPESDAGGGRANTAYRRATAPVIRAITTNQELDREEINFLWWVIADYSNILDGPLTAHEPFCRAVAAGLEGAVMLHSLPADGFRHAVLRSVGESEKKSLEALILAVEPIREKLREWLDGSWAVGHPLVFPLIASLLADDSRPATAVELDARDWGARALLEASIVALEDNNVSGNA